MLLILTLSITGLLAGLLAGLLGIGGGIVTLALLKFTGNVQLIPATSFAYLTGLSAMQSAFAATMAATINHKNSTIQWRILPPLLMCAFTGSYGGGYISQYIPDGMLTTIYATLLLVMLCLLYWKKQQQQEGSHTQPWQVKENWHGLFSGRLLLLSTLIVGGLSGILGIGGSIFMIPLMMQCLNMPLRLAMATGSVLAAAIGWASLIAKASANLVDFTWAVPLASFAILGGWLGAHMSKKVPTQILQGLLAAVMLWAFVQTIF